jgi:hypothetical protein
VEGHSGEHRRDECEDGEEAGAEGGYRRAGAEAHEAPADAEEGRATEQGRVYNLLFGQGELLFQHGASAFRDEAVGRDCYQQRADHDEGQGWVPVPGDVEEAYDLGRVHHARDGEPESEDEARDRGCRGPQDVRRHIRRRAG